MSYYTLRVPSIFSEKVVAANACVWGEIVRLLFSRLRAIAKQSPLPKGFGKDLQIAFLCILSSDYRAF